MRSTRHHCRRLGHGDYQEIIGRYSVTYRHRGDCVWTVVVQVRDFRGDPLRGQYVTLANVTGKEFKALGDARLAMSTNYANPPKAITCEQDREVNA